MMPSPLHPTRPHRCIPHAPTVASHTPPPLHPTCPHHCIPHACTVASIMPTPLRLTRLHHRISHTCTVASFTPPPSCPSTTGGRAGEQAMSQGGGKLFLIGGGG